MGGLIEGNADPRSISANKVAGQTQSIPRHNQCEFRRDVDSVRHLQRGSRHRKVADRAINCDAAEINRCGFRDTMARRDPSFDHDAKMRPRSKNLMKRSVTTGRITELGRERIWMMSIDT